MPKLWIALVVLVLFAGTARANNEKAEGERKFAGINFGVGISATVDTGSRDRVDSASIDANGIVRVDKKENIRARVMLEGHAFLKTWDAKGKGKRNRADPAGTRRGLGPFVALQPGTDEIIEAIALGIMFGAKRTQKEDAASFNIGIGYVVDTSVKVLGDEFVENMPAPLDPMGEPIPIRFQERDQGGVLLLVSFSWR